jgi:hypothetical protein
MVLLAFADMLLMWLVQLKSELNVTISVLYHECHSGQVSLVVVYVEPCQRLSKR